MQSVAPAAAGHEPARVFVHDDDLVLLHDVFHVLLVKAVALKQLRDGMDFFGALVSKSCCNRVLASMRFAGIGIRNGINLMEQRRQVRQHENASGSLGLIALRPFP